MKKLLLLSLLLVVNCQKDYNSFNAYCDTINVYYDTNWQDTIVIGNTKFRYYD